MEIGLKFARTVVSKFAFLRRGCTTACLKYVGTIPVARLQFKIDWMVGPTVSQTSLKRCGGIASVGQAEGFNSETIVLREVRDTSSK